MILGTVLIGLQLGIYTLSSGFPFDYWTKGYEIELWVLFSMSLPVWSYFIYSEYKLQRTLGKRVLKFIVTDQHGTSISFKQAFVRTFIKLLPWELTHLIVLVPDPWWDLEEPSNTFLILIPNLLLLLYATVLFISRGSKGIHDYIVKTRVLADNDVPISMS